MEANSQCHDYFSVKLFKNGPSKTCGRQPLKNFIWFILEYFAHLSDPLNLKEREKLRKNDYLENEKNFLDKKGIIFHNFWNAFFLVKYKKIEDISIFA